jgi:YVTN family beta-propeller protein
LKNKNKFLCYKQGAVLLKSLVILSILVLFASISAISITAQEAVAADSSEEELMLELPEGNFEIVDLGNTVLWVETSDGKIYVSNPKDGIIYVVDADTNKVVNTIQSMEGVSILEVVEEKNKIYASVMQYAPIQVYDLTTGESLGEIDIGEASLTQWSKSDKPYGQREYVEIETSAIGLKYNPNSELLYAVHSRVNHVNIIDTNNDENLGDIPTGKTPLLIKIDEARNIGYVTNYEASTVSVLDLETNEEIKTLSTGLAPNQMEIDHDNDKLFVTHHASSHVSVIDLQTQEIETKIELGGPTHAISLDTDNHLLHVAHIPESGFTGSGTPAKLDFVDTSSNQLVGSISIPDNPFIMDVDSGNHNLYGSIIREGAIFIVNLDDDPIYQGLLAQAEESTTESSTGEQEAGGGCLIATAAFGSELAPQVQLLREIRDNTVMSTASGAAFMSGFNQFYYSFSPTIADMERENPAFQESVRVFITPMISTLSIMTLADGGNEMDILGLGTLVIALNLGMYIAIPATVGFGVTKLIKSRK